MTAIKRHLAVCIIRLLIETEENAEFLNMNSSKKLAFYNHTPGAGKTYSYRLSGSSTEVVGPAKSLEVNAGDIVDLEVYARYANLTNTNSSVSTLLTSLISAFSLSSSGGSGLTGEDAYNSFSAMFTGGPVIGGTEDYEDEEAPKAYLNYILFDENFTPVDFGFDQVSEAAGTAHEYLSLNVRVEEKGYLYIYLSNENNKLVDVFFDDLRVTHHTGVEQSDDYYPFGLAFNSYSRENSVKNKMVKFQGQEHIDDLDLGWDSFKWRNHQPDIGRFFNVDPLSEKYVHNSVYAFSENKVVAHIELEGLEAVKISQKQKETTAHILFSITHPVVASKIGLYSEGSNNITTIAADFAINATNGTTMSTEGEGTDRNAIRHGVWQAIITRDFGKDMASLVGHAHEGFTVPEAGVTDKGYVAQGGEHEADMIADLFNNKIGQRIGEENPNASNVGLAIKVLEEFKDNGLWTTKKTENGYLISRTKITKEQYEQAHKNTRPLRQNGKRKRNEEDEK